MDDQPLIKEDEMDLQVEGGTTLPINETQMIIEKPAGGPVSKQQAEKTESGKEKGLKLENCRAFGNIYGSLIRSLTGEGKIDDLSDSGLDEETQLLSQKMLGAVRTEADIQHTRMGMKGWGAKELLEQIRSDDEAQKFLGDSSRYRMREFSKGFYGVQMDYEMFDAFIKGGGQAVAVKAPGEGISFVIIPEVTGEANQRLQRENVPHEVSHIAWHFMQKQGVTRNNEVTPIEQEAFSMYQDELVAKLVSDGPILGYTHLQRMTKEQRQQVEEEQPEVVAKINQTSHEMYDYLHDTFQPEIRNSEVSEQDCLLSVATATTFSELTSNLKRMEEIIKKQPKLEKPPGPPMPSEENKGWGSI